jgi:hypothetical protein
MELMPVGLFWGIAAALVLAASQTILAAEWADLDGQGLASLAEALASGGAERAAERAQLAVFLDGAFASDAAKARALSCGQWRAITGSLKSDMTPETKARWAKSIRTAYAAGISQMDGQSVADLSWALWDNLGDPATPPLMVSWVANSDRWQALDDRSIDRLCFHAWECGGAARFAKKRLAGHVAGKHLATGLAAKTFGAEGWYWAVFYLHDGLTENEKGEWLDAVTEACAPAAAASGPESKEATYLLKAVAELGRVRPAPERKRAFARLKSVFVPSPAALVQQPGERMARIAECLVRLDGPETSALVRQWLDGQGDWRETAPALLARLLAVAVEGDPGASFGVVTAVDPILSQAEEEGPLDLSSIYYIAFSWKTVGHEEKAQTWVMRALQARVGTEASRGATDVVSLGRIADFMKMVRLVGQGQGYPEFAAALALRAKDGTMAAGVTKSEGWSYWSPCDPAVLALPLGTSDARDHLHAVLLDETGGPRPAIAQVLSWAYANAGALAEWEAFVDERLAASSGNADRQSQWRLLRAYAASVVSNPRSSLAGTPWLMPVVQEGPSDASRVEALTELANGYVRAGRYGEALALLREQEGRLSAVEAANSAATLAASVFAAQAEAAELQREAKGRAADLQHEELLRRLEAARERGDDEAVARCKRLLGQ